MIPFDKINNEWTLFLDRDGVINHEKADDYIHNWEQFAFYDGVLQACKIFAEKFKYVIVITNQRGVGKGVTKESDLKNIHENMVKAISAAGGRIDGIYYCTDVNNGSPNRKPNPGMGHKAMVDFPMINASKLIMVGNTISDMQFGKNLHSLTVFLPTTRPEVNLTDEAIDEVFPDLLAFAEALL